MQADPMSVVDDPPGVSVSHDQPQSKHGLTGASIDESDEPGVPVTVRAGLGDS